MLTGASTKPTSLTAEEAEEMVYALTPGRDLDDCKLSDRLIEFKAKKSMLARLTARLDEEMPTRSRMLSIMRRKILSKCQVAKGSGETTGSQWHLVEMDAMSERMALYLMEGLPREGPRMHGQRRTYNWTADASSASMLTKLNELLSLESVEGFESKALDSTVARMGGQAMVRVIPPFMGEYQDDSSGVMKLTITFYTMTLNKMGVITWPPGLTMAPSEIELIEKDTYETLRRMKEEEIELHSDFSLLLRKIKKRKQPEEAEEDAGVFEAEKIIEETVGASGKPEFLVRWAGYHESWEVYRTSGEVGSPVETWEPLAHVEDSIALREWRERAAAASGSK